jgi:hypothetical protein
MPSPKRSSNEIGDSAEERAAALLQGARVVQSGGGRFLKLDVKDGATFIYSVKASASLADTALRAIWKLWVEARRGTRGPAGHGTDAKPAMIFDVNGETLVLMRLSDHAAMATREIEPYIIPSKAQERRARALRSPAGWNDK